MVGTRLQLFLISKPLHVNQRFLHYNISLYPERNKSIYWCDSGRPYNRQKDEMGPIYPGQKVLFNFAPFQCHAALIMSVEDSEKWQGNYSQIKCKMQLSTVCSKVWKWFVLWALFESTAFILFFCWLYILIDGNIHYFNGSLS